ncbi:hypothetical protein MalM25_00450 [Planctomycetes bacterium MalM25]|nr:hypothetical protein MalM25_00450 [Planctomycetes bacterium MalM25]
MRIVLDTNVLVSALISGNGPPADLFDRWDEDEFDLVTSFAQFKELERVLSYPRIAKHLRVGVVEAALFRLANTAIVVSDLPEVTLSADPDDNLILATAVAGVVDLLVSGDRKHLLPIGEVQGIPIVTASEAVARLAGQGDAS